MRLPTDTGRLKRLLAEPQTVLSRLGLLDGAKRQARGYHILCPAHDEKTASCSVTTGSDGTLAVNCFACDFRGDVFTLVAKVRSLDLRSDFPRVVAEVAALCGEPIAAPLPRRPTPPPRTLPPSNEVAALWQSCLPVTDDPDLARQLRARGIDPAVVADRDLARALPHRGPLPRWARVAAQWWRVAHRCILPLWSLAGELASVHARAVVAPDGTPKGLLPGGYSAKGLFLADAFALSLLRQGIPAWWRWPERPRLFVTEGGMDYLTVGCEGGEVEDRAATLGVVAGSWSDALADRIPSGCRVWVMTHGDEAGLNYRDQIAASLHPRCLVYIEPRRGVGHV